MSDAVICHSCGTTLPPDAAFCIACGTRVGEGGRPAAPAEASVAPVSGEDPTRVERAELHEATRVLPSTPTAEEPSSERSGWAAPGPGYPASPPEMPAAAQQTEPWQPPPTSAPQPDPWHPRSAQPDWSEQAPAGGTAWAPPPSQWQPSQSPPWPPTTDAPGVAARSSGVASGPATLAAALAFIGAALLVVCVFTPWFKIDGPTSSLKLTGWEMVTKEAKAGPFKSPDPAILLGIAAATIAVGGLLIAGTARRLMRLLLILAGGGAAAVLVRDYLSIKDALKKLFTSQFKLTFQSGFWVGAVAAVILIVAALVPAKKRT